ncbi:Y-family DNA polymerase [Candidatus Nitrosocosmicus sp. T]
MKYYIGCCGWKGQEWAKNFYPSGLDSTHYLSYYSKQFNLVHLDLSKSLFPPGSVALKKWANETLEDFRFTVKIPQNLINKTATSGQFEPVGRFLGDLNVLEEKILVILLSPPPQVSLQNTGRTWLEGILHYATDHGFSTAVDFGINNTWYQELTYNILRRYNSSFAWSNSGHQYYYPAVTSNFIFLNLDNVTINNDKASRWINLIKQKERETGHPKHTNEAIDYSIIVLRNPSAAHLIQDLISFKPGSANSSENLQKTSSTTQIWPGKIIMHIDMNAFFPACEEMRDPSLKDKAHAVIMTPEREGKLITRGAVASCSYEARKYGVRSAMSLSKAKELCPTLILKPVDKEYYNLVSQEVMRLLEEYADVLEQTSIDEAYIDCTKQIMQYQEQNISIDDLVDEKEVENMPHNYTVKHDIQKELSIREFALNIKDSIRRQCNGLICSIGVASNKSVAKIASDFQKPDGLTIVYPQNTVAFLSTLTVDSISGVGIKTTQILKDIGIETIGQLADSNIQKLVDKFGKKQALWMWQIANGKENELVIPRENNLSLSTEETLLKPLINKSDILNILVNDMTDNIYERARRKGYEFKTVGIKLVRSNFSIETREITFPSYQMNKESIRSVMGTLLNRFKFKDDDSTEENTEGNIQGTNNYDVNSIYVRKLGIKLSNLSKIDRDKKNSQKSIMDFI